MAICQVLFVPNCRRRGHWQQLLCTRNDSRSKLRLEVFHVYDGWHHVVVLCGSPCRFPVDRVAGESLPQRVIPASVVERGLLTRTCCCSVLFLVIARLPRLRFRSGFGFVSLASLSLSTGRVEMARLQGP